jgi:YegS/Rv2252/BmrU family lipid kinase
MDVGHLDVAVVAHRKKILGGGLPELRALLHELGIDPLWYEVSKSRKAPKKVRKAREHGADLVFVWGGDGMVQRCADALAGTSAALAVLPAGTANLFAANLGIPRDLREAVRIGLYGQRRRLDLGNVNGEHFAVMAGVGFDARMIRDADGSLKRRAGRLAYVWTGLRHVRDGAVPTRIRVDGRTWFDGRASCVLLGNVSRIAGGIEAFEQARPDDGWLDVGVATAEGAWQWARTLGRMAVDGAEHSPLVQVTRAQVVDVKLGAPMTYELDGGARKQTDRLKAHVAAGALTVCVPQS